MPIKYEILYVENIEEASMYLVLPNNEDVSIRTDRGDSCSY
jgi:hypothetical protein